MCSNLTIFRWDTEDGNILNYKLTTTKQQQQQTIRDPDSERLIIQQFWCWLQWPSVCCFMYRDQRGPILGTDKWRNGQRRKQSLAGTQPG